MMLVKCVLLMVRKLSILEYLTLLLTLLICLDEEIHPHLSLQPVQVRYGGTV